MSGPIFPFRGQSQSPFSLAGIGLVPAQETSVAGNTIVPSASVPFQAQQISPSVTITPFNPPSNAAFSFQPQLDNQSYVCTVTWNLFGQRWYINLSTSDGTLVLCRALVGSEDGHEIQDMTWQNGRVYVTTASPHNYDFMATVDLTIINCAPVILNGVQRCFVTGLTTFTYELATDPGNITAFGIVNRDINLVENYFNVSSMVFRSSSQQFEVSP